jgi:hypothetical protein
MFYKILPKKVGYFVKAVQNFTEIAAPSVRKGQTNFSPQDYQFVGLLRDGTTVAGSRIPYHSVGEWGTFFVLSLQG